MNWIINNLALIGERSIDHLQIALPRILVSFVLALPLGWLAHRYSATRGLLLTVSSLLYAIPSLPLFVILPVIIGTGIRNPVNLIIGLTLYGIALMVRSTADGLASVDGAVVQSATAMGYSSWARFWAVELPLAGPVLLAGIRVVSVSTISLTTVGGVLGINGLGLLFTDGFQRSIPGEIWAGIIATVVIALIIDLVIVALGRLLLPYTRVVRPRRDRAVAPGEVIA
jgi:osmoprotectant transport system permease protein